MRSCGQIKRKEGWAITDNLNERNDKKGGGSCGLDAHRLFFHSKKTTESVTASYDNIICLGNK